MSQPAFRGTRVFTTEGTEITEGMRRKQFQNYNIASPLPLCVLCALCGEYTLVMTQHELVTPCVRPERVYVESNRFAQRRRGMSVFMACATYAARSFSVVRPREPCWRRCSTPT